MKDRSNHEIKGHIQNLIDSFEPERITVFLGNEPAPILILDKSKIIDGKEASDCKADLVETGRPEVDSLKKDLLAIITELGFSKILFETNSGNTITFVKP